MNQKDMEVLAGCPVFRKVPLRELESLLARVSVNIKSYRRGNIIRFQGDEYSQLLILLGGEVSAEILSPDGKKIIIETLGESQALAAGVLFASDNTLPVTVRANKDLRIACFPRQEVIQIFQTNAAVLMNYLQDTADKVIFLAEKIRLFKFKSISQKIAGHLLNLVHRQRTESVHLTYSREQMADLFGVARPSLSRSFSEYYNRGILRAEGRIIHILDRKALEDRIAAD